MSALSSILDDVNKNDSMVIFLRRFRRATGQSPVEHNQTLRVEEAKHLLETTGKTIDQIATEIGYSEPSSFCTAFRKQVGLPASAYRKKWQGIHTRQIDEDY